LLLGVTPELAGIADGTIAVDWNPVMVGRAWPGDTEGRQAIVADWRALPLGDRSMDAAISDGCFTMLEYPVGALRLVDELRRVLRPGARLVARCFAMPDTGERLDDVRRAAGEGLNFHAFKLRFNMAVAHESGNPTVTCDHIHRVFQGVFPDRRALTAISGWSLDEIAEIDAYRDRPSILSYPSRSQLGRIAAESGLPSRFVECDGYPLAERCPLFVLDFP
jgi:SAM-dependent methyltransferase